VSAISHHFNPQVYLRQFTSPKAKNELWEYDLVTGLAKKSAPKDCGCEDFYHSFTREGGERDNDTIEKSFSSVENNLPGLFKTIRNRKPFSVELEAVFFLLAAIQRARSPRMIYSLQKGLKKLYEGTWEMLKHTPNFDRAMTARRLEPDKVREMEFDITPNRDISLLKLLDRSDKFARCLARMNWEFLCAPPDRYFFTSDDPVCCWALRENGRPFGAIGPVDADVEITFPLSRRICALGSWKEPSFPLQNYRLLSVSDVDVINSRTVHNGWHFIYGPTMDTVIIKSVEETAKSRALASMSKPANLAA
jgi:Protein of unknown function (DUF4238)